MRRAGRWALGAVALVALGIVAGELSGWPFLRRPLQHALEKTAASEHKFVAIFAQRASETDRPTREDLHTPGCLCVVLYFHRRDAGQTSRVLIQGGRWVALDHIVHMEPYLGDESRQVSQ